MIYTIEQMKSHFFHNVTEEEINRYANEVRDSITKEDVTDLIAEIGKNSENHAAAGPKEAEALKSCTPLGRITFYIREAFVAGAAYSMDMLSKVNEIGLDALENLTGKRKAPDTIHRKQNTIQGVFQHETLLTVLQNTYFVLRGLIQNERTVFFVLRGFFGKGVFVLFDS